VLTFTLSGLSKVSALPQMKVAWIATTGPQAQASVAIARLEVIADTYLSMNAPIQWATPVLLQQRRVVFRNNCWSAFSATLLPWMLNSLSRRLVSVWR